jgi:HAD superfamily hydrolase (TIGR01459 family)
MTQIITRFAEISTRYRAVFCDLWGCLHDGKKAHPAAVAALQGFKAQGGTVLLLTNSPRPKSSVVIQLDGFGVPRDCYDEVVSSGDAAQYALITGAVGHRVHHIGAPKDQPFFTDFADDLAQTRTTHDPIVQVPLTEAEGLVVTGLVDDTTETPDDYRATLLYAKTKGLKLLCANPDIVVDLGDKRLFCAGAIAQAYDAMGGESLYFGKPHPPIYDLARRRLAALIGVIPDDDILCIGDGIATDVLGGAQEGFDTLFITGGLEAARFGADAASPDQTLLDDWLEDQEMSATFAMGYLR